MTPARRSARANLRAILILGTAVIVLGVAAVSGHYIRKRIMAARALEQGLAAYKAQDWPEACTQLRKYVTKYPDDVEILEKYATALLSVRPLTAKDLGAAIGAYRHLMRIRPDDAATYDRLATLYLGSRNYNELGYIAKKRLTASPGHAKAMFWQAKALEGQRQPREARKAALKVIETLDPKRSDGQSLYVEACVLLSRLAAEEGEDQPAGEQLRWLDRAVTEVPNSALAHVCRARVRRTKAPPAEPEHAKALAAARADLEQAAKLPVDDPRVHLMVSEEWLAHGEPDRAVAEMDKTADIDETRTRPYFLDSNDWLVARFVRLAELSLRQGTIEKGVALADDVLAKPLGDRHRIAAIPYAVPLYVAAGRVADARRYVDEYLSAIRLRQTPAGGDQADILQALVAQAEGKPYRVIELLEPAVLRAGTDRRAWKMLAAAYRQTDQRRRAIRASRQYVALSPHDVESRIDLTRELLAERQWAAAAEMAAETAAVAPHNVEARVLQAEANVYTALGRRGAASKPVPTSGPSTLSALRKAHPDRADVRMLQATIAQEQGRSDEAIAILQHAIAECPETLGAELQLARLYSVLGRGGEALKVCRAACERHPKSVVCRLALSDLLRRSRDFKGAGDALRAGLKAITDPRAVLRLRRGLAMVDVLHGDRKAGVDMLLAAAAENPQDVRTRSLLLRLKEIRQDTPTAQKLVDDIRRIQGDSGLLWRYEQASLWMAGREWRSRQKDVAEMLGRCIDADAGSSASTLLLGEMCERLGDQTRAEEVYRRGLSANPSAFDVADRLLGLLEGQKRFAAAKDVLDQLEASPDSLSGWRIRTAIGAGDYEQAVEALKLRATDDAKDVDSRVLMARLIYRQAKDPARALKILDEAKAADPESMTVTAARVGILKAEGRIAEARRVLDAEVTRTKTFRASLLRAAFLASVGEKAAAEKDYIHLTTFPNAEGHQLLGRFYVKADRLDDAIGTWQKGVEAYPKDDALKRALVTALIERGRPEDRSRAVDLLTTLEKDQPDDPRLMWIRATVLVAERPDGWRQKAETLLRRVIELDATAVRAHLALVGMAMERGDFAKARDLAIQGSAANRGNGELLLARARAERALGNPSMAIRLARLVLTESPDSVKARDLLVEVAAEVRDVEALAEARRRLDEAAKKDPDSGRIESLKAKVLDALGQPDAAVTQLQAFTRTEKGQRSLVALLALTNRYRAKKDWSAAGKLIDQAEKLAPGDAQVMLARIAWLGDQDKYNPLVAAMEAYQAKGTPNPEVLIAAASILGKTAQKPRLAQAVALLERATQIAPHIIEAQHGLAVLSYQLGNADRAKAVCRKALEAVPNHPQILNDLAWIVAEADKDYAAALELADKGVALAPRDVHLRDTRGVILSNFPDRLQDARADFAKAVSLTPEQSPARAKALLRLGRIEVRLKDMTAAKQHLGEARRLDEKLHVFAPGDRAEIDKLLE